MSETAKTRKVMMLQDGTVMTTSTIHLPAALLNDLRRAAARRSLRRISGHIDDGKCTRPSVSEIVVEFLTRHLDEIHNTDMTRDSFVTSDQ